VLALLVGYALRRKELAELEIETIQRGRRICDNPTRILTGGEDEQAKSPSWTCLLKQ
jgi:hypothetical protein